MPRTLIAAVCLLSVSTAVAAPAMATSSSLVKKATGPSGSVYLSSRLVSGHSYRLDVSASGHRTFAGSATETVLGVYQKRLFSAPKSLKLVGITPKSFRFAQPVPGHLTEWVIALQVGMRASGRITVRLLDTGHRK